MNSKRFLSVLLAVLMVLAVAAPSMAQTQTHKITDAGLIELDENGPVTVTATLDKEVAHPGDTVTLTVSIAGTYQAHAGSFDFRYEMDYLEAMYSTFIEGSVFSSVSGCMAVPNTDDPEDGNGADGIVGIGFMSLTNAVTAEGMLFSMSFKVKENIESLPRTIAFNFEYELNYMPVGEEATPVEASCNNVELEIRELEGVLIKAEVDKTELKPGDTFTLTLSIAGDYTAKQLSLEVPYDPALFTVTEVEPGSVLEAAEELGYNNPEIYSESNLIGVTIPRKSSSPYLSEQGIIGKVTFTVNETAEGGDYTFVIDVKIFKDENNENVEDYTTVPATITIDPNPDPVVFKATADKNIIDDYETETFTVTVSVSGGYSATELTVELPYDETKLELVSSANGDVFSDAAIEGAVFTASSEEAVDLNGILFTATFKFIDEKGSQDFLPTVTAIKDGEGNDIEDCSAESCNVHVRQSAAFTAIPSKTAVLPGEEFTVTFSISGDYEMHILRFQVPVDFDGIEFVNIEDGAAWEAFGKVTGVSTMYSETNNEGNLSPRYALMSATEALSQTGDLCTVTYRVSNEVEQGISFDFNLNVAEFAYNASMTSQPIDFDNVPCTVTVGAPKTVIFKVSKATLATITVASVAESDFPEPVDWYGHEFKEWSKTPWQINQELAGADTVTVEAIYELIQQSFTVTVISSHGEEQKPITGSQSFTVKTDPKITDENGNDLKFLYWTLDETVISYDVKTSIRVEHDCTIEAHYDSVAPDNPDPIAILLSAKYDNVNLRETFVGYMAPLDGHRIVDCGILASSANGFTGNPEDLSEENAQYKKHYTPTNALDPVYYTWIKTNVNEGDVWYIKVFVKLEGADTVYSDCIIITAGTDFPAGTNANS